MKVIIYRVTLLEPTLVTALNGDPNSGMAYDFLPGSVLRGAIIAKYLRKNNISELEAQDPLMRQLFFNGKTRYLNGYPLDRQENRALPTPKSWQCKKGERIPIYDFAAKADDTDEQWQGVSSPFCSLNKNLVRLVRTDRHISVHTARTRRFGRAMPSDKIDKDENQGVVYRYDALAPGQTFEATIICDNDSDVATIMPLLKGEVTLGGSRSGGYGRATFHVAKEPEANWRETGNSLSLNLDADGILIITFLSDALFRDNNGQFVIDGEVITSALSDRLNCALKLQQAFLRGRVVGGFNRKWGLPLPQTLAVQMGSVFVFKAPSCSKDKLHELEIQGIGERRAEGFGRVAINWHGKEEKLDLVDNPQSSLTMPLEVSPNSISEVLAKHMVERMLIQRLDAVLTKQANSLSKQINPLTSPTSSQLFRLQEVIQDALQQSPDQGRDRLKEYLNDIEKRQTTRKQFSKAKVDGESLLAWLRFRVDDKTEIWEKEFKTQQNKLPKIGSVEAKLTPQLAYEYNLRLIHDTLSYLAKKKRKEAEL